jgi:hypothetical protein
MKDEEMKNMDKETLLRSEFQNKNIAALNMRKIEFFVIY